MTELHKLKVQTKEEPRYRAYPEYKNSGVETLGKIPAHWGVAPFKALLTRNDGGVWGDDYDDDGVLVLRSTEQTVDGRWNIENPARRSLTENELAATRLHTDDLVVTKSSGSELHIGKTTIVDHRVETLNCCFSNFMQRLRLSNPNDAKFFWYLLNSPVAREQLVYLSTTSTGLGNLNGRILGSIRVPAIPTDEQYAISNFLDRETANIDKLIAKKERLIELLEEKRTALLTQAVTKGLDPGVPMKDSGVEWIGEIPEHWACTALSRFTISRCDGPFGSGIKSEHYTDAGVRVIRLQNIGFARFRNDDKAFIEADHAITLGDHRVQPRDILIAGLGDDSHPVGRACVAPPQLGPAMVKADCFRFRVRDTQLDPDFAAYQLSAGSNAEATALARGSTRSRMNLSSTANRKLAVPTVDEQKKIVRYLDQEVQKLDDLISRINTGISLLEEYRTALITAAVTGQIDVRGEVGS